MTDQQDLRALTRLFTLGYIAGHNNTIDGTYIDVHSSDIETYFLDEEAVREAAAQLPAAIKQYPGCVPFSADLWYDHWFKSWPDDVRRKLSWHDLRRMYQAILAITTPPDRLLPTPAGVPDDYMCPNCNTPWKCNGPHIPQPDSAAPGGDDEGTDNPFWKQAYAEIASVPLSRIEGSLFDAVRRRAEELRYAALSAPKQVDKPEDDALHRMFRAIVDAGGPSTIARHGVERGGDEWADAVRAGLLAIEHRFHPERFDYDYSPQAAPVPVDRSTWRLHDRIEFALRDGGFTEAEAAAMTARIEADVPVGG